MHMKQLDNHAVRKAFLDLLKQQPTGITNLEVKNLLRMRGYHATQDAVSHYTAIFCEISDKLEFTFNGEFRTYRMVTESAVDRFLRAIGFTDVRSGTFADIKAADKPISTQRAREEIKATARKATPAKKKKKQKDKVYLCWSLLEPTTGVKLSAPTRDNARKKYKALTGTDYFDCRARVAK